jgi:hypothetical protein
MLMEPDIEFGLWYLVDHGQTDIIPGYLVGDLGIPVNTTVTENSEGWDQLDDPEYDNETTRWQALCGNLLQYTEARHAEDIYEVEVSECYGVRMSMRGYLDATDWDLFDTLEEAQDHADEEEFLEGDDDSGRAYYERRWERWSHRLRDLNIPIGDYEGDPVALMILSDWMKDNPGWSGDRGYGDEVAREIRVIAQYFMEHPQDEDDDGGPVW